MRNALLAAAVVALVVIAAACDSDGGTGTPSPTPTLTASDVVPPQETPTPTPSATPAVEVQHTVWLLNLWEEERYTIYEHPDVPPGDVGFVGARIASVTRGSGTATYGSDGRPGGGMSLPCKQVPGGGVEIGPLHLDQVPACGPSSPHGRYMLYRVPGPTKMLASGYEVDTWDQWVFDVSGHEGGHRLLAQGLVSCGGCDGRFGPLWSPDGRYVLFAETAQDGRVFVTDLQTGATDVVAHGTDIQFRPSWSSDTTEPRFLVRGEGDVAVLVNAVSGERTTLPIDWPARFDATGTIAYSPSGTLRHYEGVVTTVVDLATSEVSEVSGAAPLSYLWSGAIAISARDRGGGFTASLVADACAGTTVHSTGFPSRCIQGAYGAAPSWNGQQVAFARLVPGADVVFNGTRFSRYDIAVMDVETGNIEVVAEGAYSGPLAPRIQWGRFGDVLLVTWPHFTGL